METTQHKREIIWLLELVQWYPYPFGNGLHFEVLSNSSKKLSR